MAQTFAPGQGQFGSHTGTGFFPPAPDKSRAAGDPRRTAHVEETALGHKISQANQRKFTVKTEESRFAINKKNDPYLN